MTNEYHRQPKPVLQVSEKSEDLSLDDNIECCSWLVCDDHAWIRGQGHCDEGSLSHSSAKLVGIVVGS